MNNIRDWFIDIWISLHLDRLINFRKSTEPKDVDLLKFFRMFHLFLAAGIQTQESLKICETSCTPIMRPYIAKISNYLQNGVSLDEAMRRVGVFPGFICDLVGVGLVNDLKKILLEITFFQDQKIDIRRKVTSGLFVVKIMMVVLVVLIIAAFMVINKFKEILSDTHGELPMFTQVVINIGDAVTSHWYFVLLGIVILLGAYKYFKINYPEVADGLKFKLPVYGPIYKQLAFYRMTKIMTLTVKSGSDFNSSLRYAAVAVDNIKFTNFINETLRYIEKSNINPSDAMKKANDKYKIVDPYIVTLIKTGEAAGSMATPLEAASEDYKRELLALLQNVGDKVITPVLFVVFMIVAVIYTAIMLPINNIWSSAQQIQ